MFLCKRDRFFKKFVFGTGLPEARLPGSPFRGDCLIQPGASECPVSIGGATGHAKHLCGLLQAQAAEVGKLDQVGSLGILARKPRAESRPRASHIVGSALFPPESGASLRPRRRRNERGSASFEARLPPAADRLHEPAPSPEGFGRATHGTASGRQADAAPRRPRARVRP